VTTTTGIYVYCVGPSSHPEPGPLRGIDGAPVRAERSAGLVAWVSDLTRPPTPSLEGVRAHNAVVEAATETVTPLPFRFGQWFESTDALDRSLAERQDPLQRALQRVDRALEFGVRVLDPAHHASPPDRTTGRAYLEALALRARQDEADGARGLDVAAALRARLGPLVRDERVEPGGAGTLAAIAHLVARHDTGKYRDTIMEYAKERPELRFLVTGPWPPYGFVE
jgi:hypothetical protein